MIHRGRIGTLVLLLFTMACGGGTVGTPEPTSSGMTPSGPPVTTDAPESPSTTAEPESSLTEMNAAILDMIPAVGMDDEGQPIDPGFIFSPDVPQITIVAQVGDVAGSAMNLTWFQVTEAGEVDLFTHTVEVESFQHAYSIGTNPGTLVSGTYRVEATLEGESLSTQFEVEALETETAIAWSPTVGGRGIAGAPTTDRVFPPGSGEEGAVGPYTPGIGTGIFTFINFSQVDPNTPRIVVTPLARVNRGTGRLEVKVTMGGTSRTVSLPTDNAGIVESGLQFLPCVHPGGSDLPGTQATFESTLYDGNTEWGTSSELVRLGNDTTKPEITVNSEPPAGSQVEPGDEIFLDATAQERREDQTAWQEGLNSFKLIANPGGLVGEEQRSDAGSPQPCDRKQWSLTSQATYTVPDDAPPIIKICGEALDFAGNFSDPDACNEYYTGEAWEGPVTGHTTQPGCEPSPTPISGWMEIVIGDDGTVTGSVIEVRARFSCGGTEVPRSEQPYEVTGQKTAAAFELLIEGKPFTLPITGTHATLTYYVPGAGGYDAETIYTVDCVTCEP